MTPILTMGSFRIYKSNGHIRRKYTVQNIKMEWGEQTGHTHRYSEKECKDIARNVSQKKLPTNKFKFSPSKFIDFIDSHIRVTNDKIYISQLEAYKERKINKIKSRKTKH